MTQQCEKASTPSDFDQLSQLYNYVWAVTDEYDEHRIDRQERDAPGNYKCFYKEEVAQLLEPQDKFSFSLQKDLCLQDSSIIYYQARSNATSSHHYHLNIQ